MSTTVGSRPVTIDTSKYWNFVFPATLFAVGGFAFHVIYSLSEVQTAKPTAFNRRMSAIPTLNLSRRNR